MSLADTRELADKSLRLGLEHLIRRTLLTFVEKHKEEKLTIDDLQRFLSEEIFTEVKKVSNDVLDEIYKEIEDADKKRQD